MHLVVSKNMENYEALPPLKVKSNTNGAFLYLAKGVNCTEDIQGFNGTMESTISHFKGWKNNMRRKQFAS